MTSKKLLVGTLVVLLVTACAPQAAPTMSPQEVQNTAAAAAQTMVAQTMAAVPSATATTVQPTETASPIPLPTNTPLLNPTVDFAVATATGILLPTIAATSIPQQSDQETTAETCNKPLTSWKGPTARLGIYNETKPEGKVVLSLYVMTPLGECGYLTDLSSGPVGSYSASAFVDGKKNFKVFGNFQVQEGSWKIVIRNDKIIALGKCYPKC